MKNVILAVTDEELERLDSIGLFDMDKFGVLYQSITITSIGTESEEKSNE